MLGGGRHACMQAGCSSSSKPWTHHAHSLLVNNTVLSVVRTVECNYQPKPKTPSLAVALTSLLLICSFQFRSAFQQPHTRPYVRIVYSLSWVFSKEHRPTGNELSSFRWLYHVSALRYHVTHDYEKTCFTCTVTRVQGFKFVTFCHATA